jgi:hypothetical protein
MQHMRDGQLSFKEGVQEYEARLVAAGIKQPGLLEAKGSRPAPTASAEITERLEAAVRMVPQGQRSLSSLAKACAAAGVAEKQVSRGRVALLPLEARVRAALEGDVPSYVAYKGGARMCAVDENCMAYKIKHCAGLLMLMFAWQARNPVHVIHPD